MSRRGLTIVELIVVVEVEIDGPAFQRPFVVGGRKGPVAVQVLPEKTFDLAAGQQDARLQRFQPQPLLLHRSQRKTHGRGSPAVCWNPQISE